MSSSSQDCEEAFEEGENFIFILPAPPDPPPTTKSSSLDLIEILLVIFLLKLKKDENKEASDELKPGDEFIFQSPCEDAISEEEEDLPPPLESNEPPIKSLTPDSDLFNGNLSVDMVSTTNSKYQNQQNAHVSIRQIEMPPAFHFPSEAKLPRDVIDNAAPFPMVNQIDKEFQDLAFEEKEQLFFQSHKNLIN